MSVISIFSTTAPVSAIEPADRLHRWLLTLCILAAMLGTAGMLVYGYDYYSASESVRLLHPKHAQLRSSGEIGWRLGIFGFILFCLIFLYPIRKKWSWLANVGNARHWFDFHILMGITAPVVIAFHASFNFHGMAGIAFWIMVIVAASGVVGRYIYGQIPHSRSSAELSLQESRNLQEHLQRQLSTQLLVRPGDLIRLFRLPSAESVQNGSLLHAMAALLWIDVQRPFHVARLRRRTLGPMGAITTFGGFVSSRNDELENAVQVAREQASLSKKILFLGKSQQVFQLWHIVHRPFSYSFAVLALMHVVVSVLFTSR